MGTIYMENVLMARIMRKTAICFILLAFMGVWTSGALGGKLPGTVVLDAGHGGYDTGIIASGVKEKDLTLSLARSLKAALEDRERKGWLTRKIDQYVSIAERRKEAVAAEPGLFLSLHLSESDRLAVYTTWYLKEDSKLTLPEYYRASSAQRRYLYASRKLSRKMGRALARYLDVSVAYREMPLDLLSSVGAPAILVELPTTGLDLHEMSPVIVNAIINGIDGYELGN